MNKNAKALSILFFLLYFPTILSARHLVGGEMSYTCLGNGDYEVELKMYRDCLSGGGTFDPEASIAIYQCGNTTDCALLNQGSQSNVFSVPLGAITFANFPDATCQLPQVCIEQAIYTFRISDFDFFLPQINNSYHISYQRCCRNEAISNLIAPEETGNTYTVEITPQAQMTCNNSPFWGAYPPAIVCANRPFFFEHTASDLDGDSLVYQFEAPFLGGGLDTNLDNRTSCEGIIPTPACPPPYAQAAFVGNLYSGSQPFGSSIQLDANTGILSGTPNLQGQFVAGIVLLEYRNGQLLSKTRREFQITITDCANLANRTGSSCDDNNPNTDNDRIQEDCTCRGVVNETIANTPTLFFSEYLEGTDSNKCIEIFNPLSSEINLTDYVIKVYIDGDYEGIILKNLTGNIAPNSTYVLCNIAADPQIVNLADDTFEIDYDGDDAISLEKNQVLLDLIGNIGCDPGAFWAGAGNRTADKTLVRCPCVTTGIKADPNDCNFPTLGTQWLCLPKENQSNLGQHETDKFDSGILAALEDIFCSCAPLCRSQDSLILVDVYEATDGANWVNTWDLTQPMTTWHGVELNEDACVKCLDLDGVPNCSSNEMTTTGNNLVGSLPISIGALKNLEGLYLANNQLKESLPTTIGYLLALTALHLSNNNFSGAIPASIGNLYNLQELYLDHNNFKDSIPDDIGLLTELTALNLSHNMLTNSIPESLGELRKITILALSDNQLSGCFPMSLMNHCDIDYTFLNNPALPWRGAFDLYCNSQNQVGATCDDGHPETMMDRIQEDCQCGEASQPILPEEETCTTPIILEAPTQATNNIVCETTADLIAFSPEGFSGIWTTNSDVATIQNNFSNNTSADNLPTGISTFTWSVDTINCETYAPQFFQVERLDNPLLIPDSFVIENTMEDLAVNIIENDKIESNTPFTSTILTPPSIGNITTVSNEVVQYTPVNNFAGTSTFSYQVCYDACPSNCGETVVSFLFPDNSADTDLLPNTITPNGDGLNDLFYVNQIADPSKYPDNELIIFNRWGDVIYTAKPYTNNWDGRNRSGELLPEGTYYYVLRLDINEQLIFRGQVTILR